MPKILINLTYNSHRHGQLLPPESLARLESLGELLFYDHQTDDPANFYQFLSEADAMLTGWAARPLTLADWTPRKRPFLLAHAAGSVRDFVPKELLTRGVRVTQAASAMAPAVAQYTAGLVILALKQGLARANALRQGAKFTSQWFQNRDLDGAVVGLVGLSQIGRRMPPLLLPFGPKILAYDPYWTRQDAQKIGVELFEDLDKIIQQCDVLSLHSPVTPETMNQIDARRIGLLRPGSAFINTARAALVDQDALFARAMNGEIQAYLDVTTPEPLPASHAAFGCPHLFITPHIAGGSRQTVRRMVSHATDEIERFLRGEALQTEVTFERYDTLA